MAKCQVFSKLYKSIKDFWKSNEKEVLNSHRLFKGALELQNG